MNPSTYNILMDLKMQQQLNPAKPVLTSSKIPRTAKPGAFAKAKRKAKIAYASKRINNMKK